MTSPTKQNPPVRSGNINDHSLAFGKGLQLQLLKCARSHVKSALNPRTFGKIMFDPRRTSELAGIGESVFAQTHNQTNPFKGLFNSAIAGYSQLRGLHAMRDLHISQVGALRKILGGLPAGHPNRPLIEDQLNGLMSTFRNDKRQRLAELGAVAEPRLRFTRAAVPVGATAAVAGAAGSLYGKWKGIKDRTQSASGAGFGDRLRYLLDPSQVPMSAPPVAPPDASPGEQIPSDTM